MSAVRQLGCFVLACAIVALPIAGCSASSDPQGDAPLGLDASTGDFPDAPPSNSGSDGGGPDGTASDSAAPVVPGAPVIQSITLSAPALRIPRGYNVGGSIVVRILVSDPEGVNNLLDAEVRDVVSNQRLVPVDVPLAGSGTSVQLEETIRGNELNALAPINFPVGGGSRELEAVVRDDDGHVTRLRFQLPLACDSVATDSACGGGCFDLKTSADHCGVCGRAIPPALRGDYHCEAGTRLGVWSAPAGQSCSQACIPQSGQCRTNPPGSVPAPFAYVNEVAYSNAGGFTCQNASLTDGRRLLSCAEVPPASIVCGGQPGGTIFEVRCICELP